MCTNYIKSASINFEKFENISKKQIADLLKKKKNNKLFKNKKN